MKKLRHFIVALLFVSTGANATLGVDKYMHFGVSTVMASSGYLYSGDTTTAFGACLAVGIGKEIYDHIDYHHFDVGDLVFDSFGCATGVAFVHYFNLPVTMDYSDSKGLMLSLNYSF
ncbi:hypothetical protein F7U66_01560 [Vibrio parahaemolyticus]|nr:hypothetical protein [Vibrio parahaemolyticus]